MQKNRWQYWACSVFLFMTGMAFVEPASAGSMTVTLTATVPSGQPVGSAITWTATVTGPPGILPQFKFSVTPPNATSAQVLRDFSPVNTLSWTSLDQGTYQINVRAADSVSGAYSDTTMPFVFASRVTGGVPVVTATSHPLVALYSAPPCSSGQVRVFFRTAAGGGPLKSTPFKSCMPGASRSFYVAGMKPNTQYALQQQLVNGNQTTAGPPVYFKTGAVAVPLPTVTVVQPPGPGASLTEDVYLLADFTVVSPQTPPFAMDLSGNVLWYYPFAQTDPLVGVVRPAAGGTVLAMFSGIRGGPGGAGALAQILREVDMVGGLVRETNASTISGQLAAMGKNKIGWLSHEAFRLANGHTLILGSSERILTDVQGPGPIDVVGDMLIDLDTNFQVAWAWDSFDFLDPTRKATLGELCTTQVVFGPTTYVCPLQKASVANDWTHGNAIAYVPADGSLLLSIRNQDWVVKIDYKNGAGTGQILWRLGRDGDFSQPSADADDWFSHQHSIQYDGTHLALYDNGNLRITTDGYGNSRGQVLTFDEQARTSNLLMNFDMGVFSPASGSAQRLANGNYQFLSGLVLSVPGTNSATVEVQPAGTSAFGANFSSFAYRGFRMKDLYSYNP